MSGMTGAVAEAVGMGLLHFTWMGLLLGAGMEALLTLLRGQSPRLRYGVALSGFALLGLVPALTIGMRMASIEIPKETPQENLAYVLPSVNFEDSQLPVVKPTTGGPILYVDPPATPIPMLEVRTDYMNPVFELPLLKDSPVVTLEVAQEDATVAPPANGALAGFAGRLRASLESRAEAVAPWLTVGWIAGVLLLGLRLLGGLHYTRTLKTDGARALETRWQARVTQLCESACLRKGVRVVQSTLTKVPVVVGWFSPVVLVPVALFTGLPPKQVELLLAHELAHIKRLDPLVNLFQVVVETLLFFHPVIWRLSRRIRDERELCCDDIALAICGGRAEYAQALLHIAERTVSEPPLALAAGGGKLQQRINRILGRPVGRDRLSTPGALGLLVLTLCGAFMTGLAWAEFSRENTAQPQMSALQMENYVVVPTDAARNQLFTTEPGELWLAPYYELPALDLKLETYDGSTPEAPAPAAEPTQDFTATLTEDAVTVPAVVDPVEVIEAPEPVAVAEAAESTPESIPEKLPTPILDVEESAESVDESPVEMAQAEPAESKPKSDRASRDSSDTSLEVLELERRHVSGSFGDCSLSEALQLIRESFGLDIRYTGARPEEDIEIPELTLKNVPLSDLLNALAQGNGLQLRPGPGYMLIGDPDQIESLLQEHRVVLVDRRNPASGEVETTVYIKRDEPGEPVAPGPVVSTDSNTLERLRKPLERLSSSVLMEPVVHIGKLLNAHVLEVGIRFQLDAKTIAPLDPASGAGDKKYASDGLVALGYGGFGGRATQEVKVAQFVEGAPDSQKDPVYREGARLLLGPDFKLSLEEMLQQILPPMGLSYSVYPGTVLISTPERLKEVADTYHPSVYDVNVRFYHALSIGAEGPATTATLPADLFPGTSMEHWEELDAMSGVTPVAVYDVAVGNNALWWREQGSESAASSDIESLRVHSVSACNVPIFRREGGCGCIRFPSESFFGSPGVSITRGTWPDLSSVLDENWKRVDWQGLVILQELYDLTPPSRQPVGHRIGRRVDKGPGQDRPEQSTLERTTGIITGLSLTAEVQSEAPVLQANFQENLHHWNLEDKGEWTAVRAAGRIPASTFALAWPAGEEGGQIIAVIQLQSASI